VLRLIPIAAARAPEVTVDRECDGTFADHRDTADPE
jgi:hypothetical protein